MAKRNVVWLVVIVVVAIAVWIAAGWLPALIAAGAVLLLSEVVERSRRRQLARRDGRPAPSPLSNVAKRRKS